MANVSNKMMSPVEIVYISNAFLVDIDSTLYKTLAMLNISRIYDSDNIESSVGGIISLYALMSQSVLEVEEYITTVLNQDGIKLKKITVTSRQDVLKYFSYPDEESQNYLVKHFNLPNATNSETLINLRVMPQNFKDRFTNLNFDASSIVVYTGLCLTLICKKLDKLNYFAWVNNKWKTFFEVIGVKEENESFGPNKSLFPRLKICKDIYNFFSKHPNLRRILFLGIMKLSSQIGIWSNVCRTVLKFSKGMEMNHICLINTYILQDNPEIITMKELSKEVNKLSAAFKVFETINLPEEQWPYLKVMTAIGDKKLNKNNFPLLTYIAVQIGIRTQPSLSGYTNEVSAKMKKIAVKVIDYIYKENSVSYYNKLKSQKGNANVTKKGQIIIDLDKFEDLLRISDILEKSLHRSLGINDYNIFDETIDVHPKMLPTTQITYISVPDDADLKIINIISLLSILKIYEGDSIENIIGGIFTLANIFCLDLNDLEGLLKKYDVELNKLVIESGTDIIKHFKFFDEELNMQMIKNLDCINDSLIPCETHKMIMIKRVPPDFKSKFVSAEINIAAILSYISICLALMFKQVSTVNYPNWINHKLETFRRVLSGSSFDSFYSNCLPCSSLIPSLNICQDIYSFFSTKCSVRKKIFLTIMQISKSKHFFAWPSLVISKLAKGTEMTHIFRINNLIKHYSYFLKMRELKSELLRYLSTLEAIQNIKMPEEYWPYLRIMLNPAEAEFLNAHQFPILIHLCNSFKFLNCEENYAGGGTVTAQIESVEKIAIDLKKIYNQEFYKETLANYFELDFPNKDLLSNIGDVRLRNLYVISTILKTCKEGMLDRISQRNLDELKEMSYEDVKKKLASLVKPEPIDFGELFRFFNLRFKI